MTTTAAMPIHLVANMFPLMSEEEYRAHLADIRANGLIDPIWTWEGQIVDGRNRYRACLESGVAPRFREWNGEGSLVLFVVSLNLHRRHLSSGQRAMIALDIEAGLAEEAKERQRLALARGNQNRVSLSSGDSALFEVDTAPSKLKAYSFLCPTCGEEFSSNVWHCEECGHHWPISSRAEVCPNCHGPRVYAPIPIEQLIAQSDPPLPRGPQARDVAAGAAGTNRQYVSDAKKVVAVAPDLADKVRNGEVSLPDASREVRKRERVAKAAEPKTVVARDLVPARLEVADAIALPLDAESVDLTVTSPPYGLEIPYHGTADLAAGWEAFTFDWLSEAYRGTKQSGRLALNVPLDTVKGGYRPTYMLAVKAAVEAGWTYRTTIVWNEDNRTKGGRGLGSVDSSNAPHPIAAVEMIALFSKGDWNRGRPGTTDIEHDEWQQWNNGLWSFSGESRAWERHPAPFPEELPRRLIKLLSFPDDVVLDPFLGSGTTALVAIRLGRQAIGFDISPEYVESARRRLAGLKP
jgi:site-specific DNA-methyltransferase (adenine-specific)